MKGEFVNKIEARIRNHKCDNCGKKLTQSHMLSIQPDDALEIHFVPYYGGYFDKDGPDDTYESALWHKFWLCEECADDLIEKFPCFRVPR